MVLEKIYSGEVAIVLISQSLAIYAKNLRFSVLILSLCRDVRKSWANWLLAVDRSLAFKVSNTKYYNAIVQLSTVLILSLAVSESG